jgi:ketosteroid isomerase-like protein
MSVPDEATTLVQMFYAAFERRSIDEMMVFFAPDAVFRDHRPMASWSGTGDDYARMIKGFWELLPDGRVVRLDVLRAQEGLIAHGVLIGGTDTISGGYADVEFFCVTQNDGGPVKATDFYADEASAIARFEELAR